VFAELVVTSIALVDLEPRSPGFGDTLDKAGIAFIPLPRPDSVPPFVRLVVLVAGARTTTAETICATLASNPESHAVVAVLADDAFAFAPRLIQAGARDCIRLPVHPDDLKNRLLAHVAWQSDRLPGRSTPVAPPGLSPDPFSADGLGRALLSSCPLPVIVCDLEGRIHQFNPAAEQLLGSTERVARIRHRVADFLAKVPDANRLRSFLDEAGPRPERASASPAPVPIFELSLRTLRGESIPVRLVVQRIRDESGAVAGGLLLAIDQREIQNRQHQLDQATQQVIDLQKRVGAAGDLDHLVHELNQPLTVAMGVLEILIETEVLEKPVLDRLLRASHQLQRLADTLRSTSLAAKAARPLTLASTPAPGSETR
jgi:PAS domain S-box-containing protein